MERRQSTLIWGSLLVIGGLALLLQNFGLIDLDSLWGGIWPLLFGGAGIVFLGVFLKDQKNWWALIPGFSLLGLATLIGLGLIAPALADVVGAPIFLAAIGLGFWAVYLAQQEQWWAIIPGGVLVSVAIMVFAGELWDSDNVVGILFMGMAATFALVATLPNPQGKMSWAWIPAGVLFGIGLLIATPFIQLLPLVGAVGLIVVGGYLLVRVARTS